MIPLKIVSYAEEDSPVKLTDCSLLTKSRAIVMAHFNINKENLNPALTV